MPHTIKLYRIAHLVIFFTLLALVYSIKAMAAPILEITPNKTNIIIVDNYDAKRFGVVKYRVKNKTNKVLTNLLIDPGYNLKTKHIEISLLSNTCANKTLRPDASCSFVIVVNSFSSADLTFDVTPRVCPFNGVVCSTVTSENFLHVTTISFVSLTVTPTNKIINILQNLQYTATGRLSDGSTLDLTKQVTWASSDSAIATISNTVGSKGLARGVNAGITTISANYQSLSNSTTLSVNAVLLSITVTPANYLAAMNMNVQYNATGLFSNGEAVDITNLVTWGSSDQTVATIETGGANPGLATTIALGSSTISATYNGITGQTDLQVEHTFSSISITPTNPDLITGANLQFTAYGIANGYPQVDITDLVTWISSQGTIASIGTNGLALGLQPGLTNITATYPAVGPNPPLLDSTQLTVVSPYIFIGSFNENGNSPPELVTCPMDNSWNIQLGSCQANNSIGFNVHNLSINSTGNFIYFSNYDLGKVSACTINGTTISNCTTYNFEYPLGMDFYYSGGQTYLYILNGYHNTYTACAVQSDGTLSGCSISNTLISIQNCVMSDVVIQGTTAYSSCLLGSNVAVCTNIDNINNISCSLSSINVPGVMSVQYLTFDPSGNYIYLPINISPEPSIPVLQCQIANMNFCSTSGYAAPQAADNPLQIAFTVSGTQLPPGTYGYLTNANNVMTQCEYTGGVPSLSNCTDFTIPISSFYGSASAIL